MKGVGAAWTIDTLPQADAAAEAQYFQPSWSDRRLACRRAIREIVDRRGRLSLHEGWQKIKLSGEP